MNILLVLLVLFDSVVIPVSGLLSGLMFVAVVILGLWSIRNYKPWFIMSLIFISLAALLYLMGGLDQNQTIIQKLADWSLIFLVLGAVRLARYAD